MTFAGTLGAAARNSTQIDTLLRKSVDSGRITAVSAAAATRTGIFYQGAFGHRETGGPAISPDALFQIASMTKPVTSVAALQLVEAGRLALDVPASRYLPELAGVQVLEGFDGGKPRLRPARTAITLRHLLTHTAGFGYDTWNPLLRQYTKDLATPPPFTAMPATFDAGTQWQYGVSTDWTGKLVETVSGRTLEDYFQEKIFAPLQMTQTSYNVPVSQFPRLVTQAHRHATGALTESPRVPPPERTSFGGGGGLYSTAADYLRFAQAFLNNGKGILKPETFAEMTRVHTGNLEAGRLVSVRLERSTNEALPGAPGGFGLGFLINPKPVAGGRATSSLAWAGLFNTYFWIDPKSGIAGVILMQLLPFLDRDALDVFAAFERAIYA